MFRCDICGREFKTRQALGGHVRGAHHNETTQNTEPGGPADHGIALENPEELAGEKALAPAEAQQPQRDTGAASGPGQTNAGGGPEKKEASQLEAPSLTEANRSQRSVGSNDGSGDAKDIGDPLEKAGKPGAKGAPAEEEPSIAEQIRTYAQ